MKREEIEAKEWSCRRQQMRKEEGRQLRLFRGLRLCGVLLGQVVGVEGKENRERAMSEDAQGRGEIHDEKS